MRIGIDCRDILRPEKGQSGGIGRYVHELVGALVNEPSEHEFVLFFDDHDAAQAKAEFSRGRPNVTARVLPFHVLRRIPLLRSHGIVSMLFGREKLDLLHGPANSLPLFYRGPSVVTIHDLAVYDHPEWFPSALPGARSFSERIVVPRSVEFAERVIAVSECTKRDIVRQFGTDAQKIDVVHEGIAAVPPQDPRGTLSRFRLGQSEYVLSLSTLEPRKNIEGLIRAFVIASRDAAIPEEIELIVAGGEGWGTKPIFAAIEEANAQLKKERVRWIGRVTEQDRQSLMTGASALAYPSFYEGFGLPPLEAMSVGTPVIASNASSLPEVCGDAAILVDPKDIDGLAEAIVRVFRDPVGMAALAEKGRAHAARFTWRKAAQETLAAYERAGRA